MNHLLGLQHRRQYLVITIIIIKASCDYDDDYQGTVLQTVSPCHITPGLRPGVLRLRVRSQANPTASLSTALQAGL